MATSTLALTFGVGHESSSNQVRQGSGQQDGGGIGGFASFEGQPVCYR
jgi:hypothetical protein